MNSNSQIPSLGIGVGLRPAHYDAILSHWPNVDWFEIISENFMNVGGRPLQILEQILERYPVVLHGVNLAIGSPVSLDWEYLKELKSLAKLTKTPWVSDHLCWGRLPGAHFHDLLPLPFTQEAMDLVIERARIVQDYLELPFALENLSSYATFEEDAFSEWDFYSSIVEKANIFMMLDINNIYVSSFNQGFDPRDYIQSIPLERVIQIHLAGHTKKEGYLLDTHDQPVCEAVWKLYGEIWPKTQNASTLLEWDDHFISFEETWKEALKARTFQNELLCH